MAKFSHNFCHFRNNWELVEILSFKRKQEDVVLYAHRPSHCWSKRSPGQTFPSILSDFQHCLSETCFHKQFDHRLSVYFKSNFFIHSGFHWTLIRPAASASEVTTIWHYINPIAIITIIIVNYRVKFGKWCERAQRLCAVVASNSLNAIIANITSSTGSLTFIRHTSIIQIQKSTKITKSEMIHIIELLNKPPVHRPPFTKTLSGSNHLLLVNLPLFAVFHLSSNHLFVQHICCFYILHRYQQKLEKSSLQSLLTPTVHSSQCCTGRGSVFIDVIKNSENEWWQINKSGFVPAVHLCA